jgi:hypothetical protein
LILADAFERGKGENRNERGKEAKGEKFKQKGVRYFSVIILDREEENKENMVFGQK